MDKRGTRKHGKFQTQEQDLEQEFKQILRGREEIRLREEIFEEEMELVKRAGQNQISAPVNSVQTPSDSIQEPEDDIFAKLDHKLVAIKVAAVRQVQQALEHSHKWMWQLKQQDAFKYFTKAKRSLEQYPTPLPDALSIGGLIQELQNKVVADLGAGTGMLGIVTLLAGAKYTHFFEIDPDAFKILVGNCARIIDGVDEDDSAESDEASEDSDEDGSGSMDQPALKLGPFLANVNSDSYCLHNTDVLSLKSRVEEQRVTNECSEEKESEPKTKNPDYPPFDVVIMNPPFGTSKDEDIDLEFLKVAVGILSPEMDSKIFFVHKIARSKYLGKQAVLLGFVQTILWEFYLEVPRMIFDSKDFQENFVNKESGKKSEKSGGRGGKGAKKHGGGRNRYKQKQDVVYVRCCLVEWRRGPGQRATSG